MTDLFCENIRRWRAGTPLINRVDKALGFPTPEVIFDRTCSPLKRSI